MPFLRLSPLLSLCACSAFPADAPPVTAQRPLLSADSATVAHGEVELELGTRIDRDRELDLPTALKFGVGAATEVFLEWSPYVHVQHELDGHSDVAVGGRHRFRDSDDDGPAIAVQAMVDLPVGDDVADGGYTDGFAAVLATQRWSHTAVTGFYQVGAIGSGDRRFDPEHLLATAVAHSLDQRWGLFGELAGVLRPEQDSRAAVWTVGATFATSPTTVFDVAIAHGNGDDAQDLVLFVGLTMGLGRIAPPPASGPAPR